MISNRRNQPCVLPTRLLDATPPPTSIIGRGESHVGLRCSASGVPLTRRLV